MLALLNLLQFMRHRKFNINLSVIILDMFIILGLRGGGREREIKKHIILQLYKQLALE